MEPLNRVDCMGQGGCFLTLDPTGQWLVGANYMTGSLVCYRRLEGGQLEETPAAFEEIDHVTTSRAVLERQERPHAHQAVFDPSGR